MANKEKSPSERLTLLEGKMESIVTVLKANQGNYKDLANVVAALVGLAGADKVDEEQERQEVARLKNAAEDAMEKIQSHVNDGTIEKTDVVGPLCLVVVSLQDANGNENPPFKQIFRWEQLGDEEQSLIGGKKVGDVVKAEGEDRAVIAGIYGPPTAKVEEPTKETPAE